MGARGVGHIAELCAIAAPTVGVVTRVAAVHTEVFGTHRGRRPRPRASWWRPCRASGTAVLNAGDDRVAAMASRTDAAASSPTATAATCAPSGVTLDDELRPRFRLVVAVG